MNFDIFHQGGRKFILFYGKLPLSYHVRVTKSNAKKYEEHR